MTAQIPITTPTLTPGQQEGSDSFFQFLMSEDATFGISGGPGTGKTFLMGHLANKVMQEYHDACAMLGITPEYDEVVFTATTNKAAEVLESSLNIPGTRGQVQTIHSYLGLKVQENFKTGKTDITKTNNYCKKPRKIVFIDESSMIDEALYGIILEAFEKSKVIFVGDCDQLAPVDEELSLVYLNMVTDNMVFLDQPVRNAHSQALMALCAQLRVTVQTGKFQPIKAVPGTIEYLDDEEMEDKLNHHFANDMNPSARILCYTNKRVNFFNEGIRGLRNLPDEPTAGDTVVVASAYVMGKVSISVERELQIIRVDYSNTFEFGYGELFDDGVPLVYCSMQVMRVLSGIATTTPNDQNTFFVNYALDKPRWDAAIKELKRQKSWSEYFMAKGTCADLRDKSACTVYKSQGSTYETVFIDLGNIGTSWDAKQVARLLFVAASRASTKIYLYGRLPNKYT
jgi:hypothetical protein